MDHQIPWGENPHLAAVIAPLEFNSAEVESQWKCVQVDPWLRVVLVTTAALYQEQGAKRCRVLSMLMADGVAKYGRQALVSVTELPGVRMAKLGATFRTAAWVVERLNVLWPFGEGQKETAVYRGDCIILEVPAGGFKAHGAPLREWPSWGAKAKVMTPRKIRLVEG